jgi:hypothetical protein
MFNLALFFEGRRFLFLDIQIVRNITLADTNFA